MIKSARASDLGSATLEAAVIVPALLVILGLVVAGGRLALTSGSVQAAAREAARAASLARDPATADAAAFRVATDTLSSEGLACTASSVHVDASGFAAALGSPAVVRVTVECTVALADVLLPGLPGTRQMTATFASPLDPYRARSDRFLNPGADISPAAAPSPPADLSPAADLSGLGSSLGVAR